MTTISAISIAKPPAQSVQMAPGDYVIQLDVDWPHSKSVFNPLR